MVVRRLSVTLQVLPPSRSITCLDFSSREIMGFSRKLVKSALRVATAWMASSSDSTAARVSDLEAVMKVALG